MGELYAKAGRRLQPPTSRGWQTSQTGPAQQFHKLPARAHVDRFRGEVAGTIVNESLGDAANRKEIVHFAAGIEQDRILNFVLRKERIDRGSIFIRDRENGQA